MKTRVLMFGWEFPPHNSGGLGTACFGLTKALAQTDTDIIFVLPKNIGATSDFMKVLFAETGGVRFESIQTILSPYITSNSYDELRKNAPFFVSSNLIGEVLRYAEKAREIAKREEFDVIHAHDWLSFAAGIEAKKMSGKPLIAHVHATEFDRTGGQGANEDVYKIERAGLEHADKVVAVSNFTKERIVEQYGIPREKIEVVHNGIEAGEWKETETYNTLSELKRRGKKIVLFVGRITVQKGPEYFIRAAKTVLEHAPNTLFVMSGSGDMQQQVMKEAAYLGIGDKMLFPGFLRDKELRMIYQLADLYVMPSVSEPFGITALESLASGVPAIISRQSGVSEVLNHALKVDFWDTDDLANKILGVISHNVLQETLRDNGKKEVAHVTWKNAAAKCVAIYESLMNKHVIA